MTLQMRQQISAQNGLPTAQFYNSWAALERDQSEGLARASMLSMMDLTVDSTITVIRTGFRVDYSGSYQEFEVAGSRIISVVNGTGGQTDFTYSTSGVLSAVTHSGGGAI